MENLLNSFFNQPYRPEFLVKKVRKKLENYQFKLIQESTKAINKSNKIFFFIFREEPNTYKFNNDVKEPKSMENFKNFVYEENKLNILGVDNKELLSYLFILEKFNDRIINAIYNACNYYSKNYDIFYNIVYQFLYYNSKINKVNFDNYYFPKWIGANHSEKNEEDIKELEDLEEFKIKNIKKNLLKYDYYGPNETKSNYILNKIDEKNERKVLLFSPDFLIKKGFLKKYDENNFQVFNENNICPNLFIFMIEEVIKELNNKIKGNEINNKFINDVGIMEFQDKTVGVYLNMINPSQYFEIENIVKNLFRDKKEDNLEVVYSISTLTESKTIREENRLTEEQDLYVQYNSHVNEEQLSNAIVNSIGDEILHEGMERLPRVIFYFNLYLYESLKENKRISFTSKEKGYGFEEADGIFYIENKCVILNESGNIPFFKKMSFDFFSDNNGIFYKVKESSEDSKINIEKFSLIYMEVKNSFPLKIDGNQKDIDEEQVKDTKKLINSIIRKSKKFLEIALNKKKIIKKIHILFLYDSILQTDDEMILYKKKLNNIFKNLAIKIEIKTTFDIIFFVNPSSMNTRKLTETFIKLKKENLSKIEELQNENQRSNQKIRELQKENQSKIEDLEKKNQNSNQKIEELEKKNQDSNQKIEELEKKNQDSNQKIEDLKKENQSKIEDLKKENQSKIEELEKKNQDSNQKIENLIMQLKALQKQLENMRNKNNDKDKDNDNRNNVISEINSMIKKGEIVYAIKGLNDGLMSITTQNNTYIVKNNAVKAVLSGYIKMIFSLDNENILAAKTRLVLIYDKNNFSKIKEINMIDYTRQIIELKKYDNKILFLSEETSKLKLIENNDDIDTIYDSKKENNVDINSIIEGNTGQIIMILMDTRISFFDLKSKTVEGNLTFQEDIKRINNIDISFIYENYLYISLFNSIYKIDINKKEKISNYDIKVTRIYMFNNNAYGIYENCIYLISEKDNKINANILLKDEGKIYSLFETKKGEIIFSNDKEVKFYNFK